MGAFDGGGFHLLLAGVARGWVGFRRLVRPAFLQLLPGGLAAAIPPERTSLGLAVAAVLLGALTHIGWDGFTHSYGWAVAQLPVLSTEVAARLVPGLRWYKVLQYGSTLVGLTLIGVWVARWVGSKPRSARNFATG